MFRSVPALELAIAEYLAEHNKNPKPFTWVADADSILDRIKRVCKPTSDSGPSESRLCQSKPVFTWPSQIEPVGGADQSTSDKCLCR